MHRRTFLAAAAIGTIAGCTSGETTQPTDEPTPTDTPTATSTPTATPTATPEPAEFELVGFGLPEQVEIGEEFVMEITVRNVGGRSDTFQAPIYVKTPDSDWEEGEPWSFGTIDPGEEVTAESNDPISIPYMTELEFALGDFDETASLQVVSKTLNFQGSYTSPDNIKIVVLGVGFLDSYDYSIGDYNYTETASDGMKFAEVNVSATNKSGSPEWIPLKNDFAVLVGNQQFDYVIDRRDDSNIYEGGEVQAGVTRSGRILYEVPEDVEREDLQVAWSESYYEGDVAVYWSE